MREHRPGPRDPVARWQTYADYLEAEIERLREALRRAHDALDRGHDHTPETWDDRRHEREST